MSDEVYRSIRNYEGLYRVSNHGNVYSIRSKKLLRPRERAGYYRVVLQDDGVTAQYFIHRLVLETFVGPCPAGMECRHLNGDRIDNRVENLAWGTRQQNAYDRIAHGTQVRGMTHHKSKLTDSDVAEIRRRIAAGERGVDVARAFSITPAEVSKIKLRQVWPHIP